MIATAIAYLGAIIAAFLAILMFGAAWYGMFRTDWEFMPWFKLVAVVILTISGVVFLWAAWELVKKGLS